MGAASVPQSPGALGLQGLGKQPGMGGQSSPGSPPPLEDTGLCTGISVGRPKPTSVERRSQGSGARLPSPHPGFCISGLYTPGSFWEILAQGLLCTPPPATGGPSWVAEQPPAPSTLLTLLSRPSSQLSGPSCGSLASASLPTSGQPPRRKMCWWGPTRPGRPSPSASSPSSPG